MPSKPGVDGAASVHPQDTPTTPAPPFADAPLPSTSTTTPLPLPPPPPTRPPPSTTKPKLSPKQKVDRVLQAVKDVGWGMSDFLYYLFLDADHLSMGHAQTVSKFLKGETRYTPANIIQLWLVHPAGRLLYDEDRARMHSVDVPWTKIKPVRPALTSFASQKAIEKCVSEAKLAVKPTSGLHASARKNSKHKLEWRDTGLTTFENAQEIIHRYRHGTVSQR
ncbi:hypothetical protein FA13DRAFT_1794859 [Coprinellus micaceus]|uniref:Uncharacterized protein n=1 Tax=Coprinellus micaceus TaxID=71717 RepID=A0A4Y7T033_COPMI|nr:hypothetical protein FA13DRAFT_1794859 [Coprinellus micaceus]